MSKTGLNRPLVRKDGDEDRKSYSYSYKYQYYGGYKRDRRPRKLNFWLLIATVVVFAICVPAIYYWHASQLKSLSTSLLTRADEQAKEENWKEASDAYYRVWEIRKEPEVLGKLASSYDKYAVAADPMGVIAYYQRAIGALPDRLDFRVRLSELLLRSGQSQLAKEQAELVLAKDEENKDGRKWRALAVLNLQRAGKMLDVDVLSELKAAYAQQAGDFDLAFGLIGHLRRDLKAENGSEEAQLADQVMNSVVRYSPEGANAYLARYQYRVKYGLPGAKQDISKAIILAPDNPIVIEKGAWDALRDAIASKGGGSGDYLTTRQLFKKLIDLRPEAPSGYLGLGDAEYLVKGNVEEAIKIWDVGRQKAGNTLPLLLRIAEGQTNLYEYDKAQQTLNDVDNMLSSLSSRGSESDRKWATASAALFRGKIKLSKNELYDAIPDFQLAASLGSDQTSPNKLKKSTAFSALMSLGKTFDRLGQFKNSAASYDQALTLQPDSENALLSAADSWAGLGDLDRAINNAERALKLPRPSAQAHRYLAQYLLERQIAKPEGEREWNQFDDAFKDARWQLADSWKLRFIDVDHAIRRSNHGDISVVLGKLLSIESDFPEDVQVWRRLPFIYETIGAPEDTDRALNRLEEITSSSPETKFVLVDILLARNKINEAQIAIEGISENQLTPQQAWLRDLAQLRIVESEGDSEKIDQLLARLIGKYPMNVSLVERFLDRRLCGASATESPTTDELLTTLKARQVNAEPNWQYFAARLELASDEPDSTVLRTHLASLQNRLPYWTRTEEIAGRIAVQEGNEREARIAFEDAVSKPYPNPELVHMLIGKHLAASDYLAAMELVELQQERAPLSRLLSGKWSDLQESLDFKLVTQGAKFDSPSHEILWKQATEEVPTTSFVKENSNSVLATFFSLRDQASGQNGKPKQQDLPQGLKLFRFDSNSEKAFVFGQVYEYLGKYDEAKQSFQNVDETSPYRYASEVYMGLARSRQKARSLAVESTAMLASDSRNRLEAVFLLRRSGKNDLKKAKVLLEQLITSSASDLNDRRLLASCLEKLNQQKAAKKQLLAIVETTPSAQHLTALVDFLLRNGSPDEAQVWLEQLEDQSGWSKTSVGLRTRWMAASNRLAEIKPFVELFAQQQFRRSPDDIPAEMRAIATIYRDVNMLGEAKRWLGVLASRFPHEAEPLSFLLVENDETERAIQRCVERLRKNPDVNTASLLARILVYGDDVSAETMQQVQPLLEESLDRFPMNPSLLFAIGNLHLKQEDPDRAADLLTKVTKVRPGHYLAWNNLAALLAEQPDRHDEAISTIEKAISYAAYDVPTLYDTKAVVLMHRKEYQAAADLLQQNVTHSKSAADPRFYFHLAMSLDGLENMAESKTALAKADDLDLDSAFLTPYEQAELDRLREKFGSENQQQL